MDNRFEIDDEDSKERLRWIIKFVMKKVRSEIENWIWELKEGNWEISIIY
ncbi:MAG: hypothetical protein ACI87N_002593 [Flavobacteriales bacterium]